VYDILGVFHQQQGDLSELSQTIAKADAAHQAIVEVLKQGEFEVKAVEPAVIDFADAAKALRRQTAALKSRLISDPPEGFSAEQLERLQGTMTLLASKGRAMAKYARAMHVALYDDNYPLRVAPALNAAALERDRDTEKDDAQPWLALQTVTHGSDELLQDYPQGPLNEVRAAYAELGAAYRDRDAANRPALVEQASADLAHALRALGEQVEPLREKLPIRDPDAALMAFTQYPPVGYTDTEVAYNQLDPFKWAWVLSLLATTCFALAFGVIRKPMFWLGAAVLLGGLLWTVFSFYLRVSITRWAPVTNMYETVVYVPFVVSLLGAWFMLLPLTWPGLKAAWRLSAIPGTWESTALGEDQTRLMGEGRWKAFGFLFAAARVALMAVTFYYLSFAKIYDGGSTVLSLTPQSPVTMNSLVVWFVGMCVLVSAVWYLPRLLLTLLALPVFMPLALRGQLAKVLPTVYPRWPFGLTATLVAFLGSFIAWYEPIPGKEIGPLMPVLRSNFWLTIHVLTIVSSYAAGALAWGLGNLTLAWYLFGKYRAPAATGATAEGQTRVAKRPPAECAALAGYCYKAMQVAVLLLAAGTILGGLWADVSWGRFWGWDPKEVFALVSLLIYLAVLHGRYAGWFGNFGLAVGTILGASAITMSWYGVNFILGVGLHAYGFGDGGQLQVGAAVAANWAFLGLAALRYWSETQPRGANPSSGGKPRVEEGATA
jgi:ABC-type transport system involved in cytochrome c biogenesis permease subunit